MATSPPMSVSGSSTIRSKSFVDILSTKSTSTSSIPDLGRLGAFKGAPALLISKHEVDILCKPFANALVGRFVAGRPPLADIRKFFDALGLKAACPIALLDSKHTLIRPALEEDYTRNFKRRVWFVNNKPMSVGKWTFDFRSDQDVSIVPIWVELPELPLPFFNKFHD